MRARPLASPVAANDDDRDFGGVVSELPRLVSSCVDGAGLVQALRTARTRHLAVTVRGAGRSCGGQAVGDGLLVRYFGDDGRPPMLVGERGESVDVPARASWGALERWLNARGRSVPVTPDYLDLSIGGTLSVGGFGVDSIRHGTQTDHVESARLRLADGRLIHAVRGERDELLHFVLAGLGRLAILESVTMRTVPERPAMRVQTRRHTSLEAMAEAMGWLATLHPGAPRPDTAGGSWVRATGACVERYGERFATAAEARTAPAASWERGRAAGIIHRPRFEDHAAICNFVDAFPNHRRMWCDFLFEHDAFCWFVSRVEARLREGRLPTAQAISLGVHAPPPTGVRAPAFDARAGARRGAASFGCGLYAMVPEGRDDLVAATARALRECLDDCIALGGRPYLYGCCPLNDADKRALYGAEYDRFLELKQAFDPHGRLASGRGF